MQISNNNNNIAAPVNNPSISAKIDQAAKKVSIEVQKVAITALMAYKSTPPPRNDKQFYTTFFATHITDDKKSALSELSQRVKNIVSLIANKAGADAMKSPISGMILGTGAALTKSENVTDLFLTQSVDPAQQIEQELQTEHSPEDIDKFINDSLDQINPKT